MNYFILVSLLLSISFPVFAGEVETLENSLDAYVQKWVRYPPGTKGAPSPEDLYILIQARYALSRIRAQGGGTPPALPPQVSIELYPEASHFELLPPPPKGLSEKQIEERKRKWREWKMRRTVEWRKELWPERPISPAPK
jgi:hypothetical protein